MNSDCKEAKNLLNTESQEQLLKMRNVELNKALKLGLILKQLKRLKPAEEQVRRALKLLTVADYIKIGDKTDEYLLDLHDCLNINLSYTERKAVRQQLVSNLRSYLQTINEFGEKLFSEWPELFSKGEIAQDTKIQLPMAQKKILDLEAERRDQLNKLAELRNRKCALLKTAAELKMGPYLQHELHLLESQARLSQIKTNLLRGYFINELISRSDHSLKAHKEVEGYINEALAQFHYKN